MEQTLTAFSVRKRGKTSECGQAVIAHVLNKACFTASAHQYREKFSKFWEKWSTILGKVVNKFEKSGQQFWEKLSKIMGKNKSDARDLVASVHLVPAQKPKSSAQDVCYLA